jgi:hypothetical protein
MDGHFITTVIGHFPDSVTSQENAPQLRRVKGGDAHKRV